MKKSKPQTFGQRLWEILNSKRPDDIKYPAIMNLLLETHIKKSEIDKKIDELQTEVDKMNHARLKAFSDHISSRQLFMEQHIKEFQKLRDGEL
jgi:hypothetical protein